MHWLPLVAMVIASALPFPHNPVSRIAAATTEPGIDNRREARRESASRLATPTESPVNYDFHGNASQKDYKTDSALSQDTNRLNYLNQKDYGKSSANEELSTYRVDSQKSYQTNSNDIHSDSLLHPAGGKLRASSNKAYDSYISKDNPLLKDYEVEGSKRDDTNFADFPKKDDLHDSTENRTERNDIRTQVSVPRTYKAVSTAASLSGQRGPEPTVPSEQLRDAATERASQQTLGGANGLAQADESLSLEAGLGLGTGLGSLQEGDELFLDAHPRVLFSPSPSPPEHPPMLLMLESGMLPEDTEDQEDMDGHIEGHGDRAMDRNGPPSGTDAVRGASEVSLPVKRNKRSHLFDTRRGERSVCESESVWVTDKKSAIDSHGRTVTILPEIQTQKGPLKQYFFETRCRAAEQPRGERVRVSKDTSGAARATEADAARSSCLGVDKKQWVSECKAKQTFVRALTKDENNRTGWRWIRIDSSCVCVLLSRANRQWGGRA
ncbi:uncharacterized protein ntf4 [Genypterus blacodes]|uniref:uncharacterized protein ntf4 n=1 Tax=Genypterus blacodes TaxID=154954 RepID=UPI003F75E9FC